MTLPLFAGTLQSKCTCAEVVAPAVTLKLAEPAQVMPELPASDAVSETL
jgi:hypothetical protein